MVNGECTTPNRPPAVLGVQGTRTPPSVLGTQAIAGLLPNTGAGVVLTVAGALGVVMVAGGALLLARRKPQA